MWESPEGAILMMEREQSVLCSNNNFLFIEGGSNE